MASTDPQISRIGVDLIARLKLLIRVVQNDLPLTGMADRRANTPSQLLTDF